MAIKGEILYQGKAKVVYTTDNPNHYWVSYKDSLTANNGLKKSEEVGKGILNNSISAYIFRFLSEKGVTNHFIKQLSNNEMLVKKVSILPIEVVVRNIAAGSICKRLGFSEGTSFRKPIIEFYYKDDSLGDPLISESHIDVMELAKESQVEKLKEEAVKVNDLLKQFFYEIDLSLVDFKLEFGTDEKGCVILADEISPDTCRLWDVKTGENLDKDIFRKGKGDLSKGYTEVLNRIKGRFS